MKRKSTISVWGSRRYTAYGSLIPPVYRSVVHLYPHEETPERLGKPLKYSREGNPSVACLEDLLALLEAGEAALAFSSGMAALSTLVIGFASRGDSIVAPRIMYGTTRTLLERLSQKIGYKLHLVDPYTDSVVEAIERLKPRMVIVETIVNPTLYVFDIPRLVKACRDNNCMLIVDNTIATPVLYNPLADGASIVVHSLTKYIAGHNDAMGGAIVSSKSVIAYLWEWRRLLGGVMDPEQAYLIVRGAKTLHLRVERQCSNAMRVAEYLKDHPRVEEVYYPGLPDTPGYENARRILRGGYGGMVSFKVRGGVEAALKVMKNLKMIKPTPSFGGVESTISHPASSSHAQLPREERARYGVTDNLLRLSVGIEDVEDIIEDLSQALSS